MIVDVQNNFIIFSDLKKYFNYFPGVNSNLRFGKKFTPGKKSNNYNCEKYKKISIFHMTIFPDNNY